MIFIDTGAWIERDREGAEHRDLAERGWRALREQDLGAATTDLVLSELATYVKRAGAPEIAVERAADLLGSRVVKIEPITDEDRQAALRLFRKFRDQPGVSWCDCMSFAVMKRLRTRRAFAFDGDFDRAGFEFWPDPSFSPRRGRRT